MHHWKFSALAAAAIVCAGFYTNDATALALGRITVKSALGEPLRAEIDIPQITPAEADSLRATTATAEAFRAQGMEYTQAMNSLQIQLQRRPDGRAVLILSSDRPVNEPFLDLVLDANWGSGRIVRSYTMLFDPPELRRAAPGVTAPAQIAAAPAPSSPSARTTVPATRPAADTPPPTSAARAPAPVPANKAPATARMAAEDAVTVRSGDTAGRIAGAYKPAGISLDQMLVAMMRANPDAFVQGNVNRLKTGAVLQIPDQQAAQATPAPQARQIMAAQARDFNEFRRKLAGVAPLSEVASAQRSASGTVQTKVEDKKSDAAAPDKLTLSKGALKGQKTAEDKVAQTKQENDAAARMAELSKNITDLNKLGAASAAPSTPATPAPSAVSTPSIPAIVVAQAPTAPPVVAVAPPEVAEKPITPLATPEPAAVAPTVAAPPAVEPPVVWVPAQADATPAPTAPAAAGEPSFLDGLADDPLLPVGGGLLIAALLGLVAYRVTQRRRQNANVDSSFMESRTQPDSFFGASGGQRVDTANSEMTTGSSMAYSPSQLDAGGDVDPVAEADVYLAYGRDQQAEDILKEAIRHNPGRVSVLVKLGEIYAKRQDRKALEATANDVFKLTQGEGPDWARIVELGAALDPENRLYQPGGAALAGTEELPTLPPIAFPSTFIGENTEAARPPPDISLPPDLDLDLDLDLALSGPQSDDAPAAAPGGFAAVAASAAAQSLRDDDDIEKAMSAQLDIPDGMSFMAPTLPEERPVPAAQEPAEVPLDLDFLVEEDQTIASKSPAPLPAEVKEPSPMEFDLGELSLDLDLPPRSAAARSSSASQFSARSDDGMAAAQSDPLATKLALAEEFNAIGDIDGARTLIEEVVAESTGALKTRAQRMLSELG